VEPAVQGTPSYYKFAWLFTPERGAGTGAGSREQFLAAVQAEGVALNGGFRGFLLRGPQRCRRIGTLAYSQHAAQATVLLHHPVLLESEAIIDQVAHAIEKVANRWRQP
jgi:hypothetical protein